MPWYLHRAQMIGDLLMFMVKHRQGRDTGFGICSNPPSQRAHFLGCAKEILTNYCTPVNTMGWECVAKLRLLGLGRQLMCATWLIWATSVRHGRLKRKLREVCILPRQVGSCVL